MKIIKQTEGGQNAALNSEDLELIGALARKPLEQEEVYTFSVRLCDNEIDRDFERFTVRTLEQLAPMFVGKAGIFDHQWSARGQAARIYKTEIVREPGRGRLLLAQGLRLHGAHRRQQGPDRRDRGGHQEGGQRGLRRGARNLLHLWLRPDSDRLRT